MPPTARQPILYHSGICGAGPSGKAPGIALLPGGILSGGTPVGCGSLSASVMVIVGGMAGVLPVLTDSSAIKSERQHTRIILLMEQKPKKHGSHSSVYVAKLLSLLCLWIVRSLCPFCTDSDVVAYLSTQHASLVF